MPQPLLEGEVDNRALIEQLEEDNRGLQRQLVELRTKLAATERQNKAAVQNLRRQLEPLYRALQQVFGEIEAVAPNKDENAPEAATKSSHVWAAWKSRLGVTASKCIDALLTHGELNTQQLAIATGLHRTTVPQGIHQLNKAGLINKSGGRFSLKQL